MPVALKQSTASQEIVLGYFVDSTDGNTEETGLTIANTDIKIWKNGATSLANKNSGGATHISNGIYYAVLDATDTDTLGPLIIFVHVSGALTVRLECEVLPANVYDSLYSTDKLQVDCVEKSSSALDFTTTEKASMNTEVDSALDTAVPGTPTSNSINERIKTMDDAYTATRGGYLDNINNPALASIALTGTYVNAQVKAQDNIDFGALQKASLNAATPSVTVSDKTGFSLAANQSTVTVGTVNTLTNWDKTGYALSSAGIDSIWDEVTEGTLTVRQALKLTMAMLASKSSGGGSNTLVYRDYGDSKDRLTFTVDADGNRTAVSTNVT